MYDSMNVNLYVLLHAVCGIHTSSDQHAVGMCMNVCDKHRRTLELLMIDSSKIRIISVNCIHSVLTKLSLLMMDEISFFALVITLTASLRCGRTAGVVNTVSTVQGWKGEDIRLPCHFQGEPAAVTWVKESVLYQPAPKAEFSDGNFESLEEGFEFDKNFSLSITDLKFADGGHYVCRVLLKNFENIENSVHLTVNSMASSHIIEECVNRSQSSQNRCTYQAQSNATSIALTCVVSGFKPDISMMWTDASGERLQSLASLQTTLSDDTYERFEKITVSANHGTEQTFVCTATGDAVNGTSTKEITLLPTSKMSGKRNNVGLIIGLVIGIPAAVSILFLLVRKFRQTSDQEYLQQRVSEEPSPTVQTTMDNEDESRKWYSVQWSDFKLCCRRLKDVSTQQPRIPICVYALYRFLLAGYFFAFFITYVTLAGKALGPKFLIYVPFWTYVNATCYVCLACFNAAMDLKKNMTKAAAHEDKYRYQIQWFLFNLTAAPSIITTIFDWGGLNFIISDKVPFLLYVSFQPLPAVVSLIEIFLTLIVVRFVHAVYPFFYAITYVFFIVTYWAAGGTDPFGNRVTPFILDFENHPSIAAGTLVGATLSTLVIQAILKGLYALRVQCMDRRTQAVPRTDEVLAVELEAPTRHQ